MKLKKGCLLLAEPAILDDISFNRAVIILAEHNEDGSVGFIINKPLQHTIQELIPEINAQFIVYNGGPVAQENLYFIHTVPHLIADSIEIADGIYWGGDFEATKVLINQGLITKENIRFFLGYTGWEYLQLETEMEQNAWLCLPNDLGSNLIAKSNQHFWKNKMEELGGAYLLFSNAPENPALN